MTRTVGSSGARTEEAIRREGLRLLHEQGYAAMSMRQLAATVGVQPGSLYNYFRTKQDFLFGLIRLHMQDLHAALDTALVEEAYAQGSAVVRLERFVAFHVAYHIERPAEVFICYSELRSLDPDNLRAVVAMREAYERRLAEILDFGLETGAFRHTDTRMTTFAILAMLSGICTWFRPGGRLAKDEVGTIFTDMVLGLVGVVRSTVPSEIPAPVSRLAARRR